MRNITTILLALVISLFFNGNLSAQNSMEAKAAYLLAEESFEAGKYADCINYLDEAAKKLGTANAKILYLKIMALQMEAEKDGSHVFKLSETINLFEKVQDIESFNEEKKLEVYKLKLKTNKLMNAIPKNNVLEIAFFQMFKTLGLKLGMQLSELQSLEPDFFTKAQKVPAGKSEQYHGTYRQIGVTLGVHQGIVQEITVYPPGQDINDSSKNSRLVNEIKTMFGGTAQDTTITTTDNVKLMLKKLSETKTKTRTITWIDQNVRLTLKQSDHYSKIDKEIFRLNMVTVSVADDSLLK